MHYRLHSDDDPGNDQRALLSTIPEIEVIGGANNGEEALALAGELSPGVILMDLKNAGHERHRRDAPHP